jgi:membrane protease subunit HflC
VVRETETALRTTLGKATEKSRIVEPGLYFKVPLFQKVHKFDSRMRTFTADLGETTTKGAIPVIINSYAAWRIADPLKFFNTVKSEKEAENKLRSRISDTQNRIVGQYSFSEFVNSDPSKIKIEEIEGNMLNDLAPSVSDDYGIQISAIGIKQLKINEDVTGDVFERMRAERSSMTQAIIASGEAEATRIKADADSKKTEILAAAEARAKAIRGEGDAEAAKYYKMLESDPELAMFLRDIESLKKILEHRSTVVFSSDSAPFSLLKNIPDIEPK